MAFLFQMRFNASGCTNSDVVDYGGVSYKETSPLVFAEDNNQRCAYFRPCHDGARFSIRGSSLNRIKSRMTGNGDWTLYFKFKIDLSSRMKDLSIPILSYISGGEQYNLLTIEKNQFFQWYYDRSDWIPGPYCGWVFDDNWHTFTFSHHDGTVSWFIDGFKLQTNPYPKKPELMSSLTTLYIGARDDNGGNHFVTYGEGYLDDFWLVDYEVWDEHFVPPNLYFSGYDKKDNYQFGVVTNAYEMPRDVMNKTEEVMLHSAFHLNEKQKEWLPRRARIQWHEEDKYFHYKEYIMLSDKRDYTAISFNGLEQPLWIDPWNERCIGPVNAESAVQDNQMYAFVLFVDGKFIKLSDISIEKSDQFYTLFIKGRAPDKYNLVKQVELIIIPFPCIYEEDMGIRDELTPLYMFDLEGYFNPYNAYTYYYIDPDRTGTYGLGGCANLGCIEQNIPIDPDNTGHPQRFAKHYWRYGFFEKTTGPSSIGSYYRFVSTDNTIKATPDKEVNVYHNKVYIHRNRYTIEGPDLFHFDDGVEMELDINKQNYKIISMEHMTDAYDISEIVTIDSSDLKMRTVYADHDFQSSFEIPVVPSADGYTYTNFLVFHGGVCYYDKNRYRIVTNKRKFLLLNHTDFLDKGDFVTFLFFKTRRGDEYGPLHVKPHYLYTKTGDLTIVNRAQKYATIKINYEKEMQWTKDLFLLFVNGTLIRPDRYDINSNNEIVMRSDLPENDFFGLKEVLIVFLTFENEYDDPTDPRGKIIREQMEQGGRFILFDLNIDPRIKLTLDNFVIFDQNGQYMPDITGEIMNMNIIKVLKSSKTPLTKVPRYLTIVYSETEGLDNYANVTRYRNYNFVKAYIRLLEEFYEVDYEFEKFISDFDARYRRDAHYGVNLAKAFLHIMKYNELHYLDMYKNRQLITRKTFKAESLNQRYETAGPMGPITMQRSMYKHPNKRTFHMIFEDGMIPEWHKNTEYRGNQMVLRLPGPLDPEHDIDFIEFHEMSNTITKLDTIIL